VPDTQTCSVVAITIIESNTYTSAPMTVTGSAAFLARVMQQALHGAYLFEIRELRRTARSAGIPDDDHQPGDLHH